MAFRGWPAEAIDFFEGLEADNSRSYWQDNKAVYERAVRAPMLELLGELAGEFGEGRIFRPNRDVRFSLDKSPYKTNIAATLERRGYLSVSADGLQVGSGYYVLDSRQLERYRAAVADEKSGRALEAVVGELAGQGITTAAHEVLRSAPRGYPKDHPRIELLRRKGLVAWRQWPPGPWLGTTKPRKMVAEFLRASVPLNAWLDENVGAPQEA